MMDDKKLWADVKGLTTEEVNRLTKEGKTNELPDQSSQSVASIIIGNVVTYFNIIFFGLAFLVIMVKSYVNLTFMVAVILNMLIGIVQQLRAKKVLDKLSLLDVTEYSVIRDGELSKIDMSKLVIGDCMMLASGQQIPADAEVISGKVSVNEALLTGEADEVEKEEGAALMSGSFVVSGECVARLTKVGTDSYAARLTAQAKEVKQKKSEMIRDIETIILIAGIIIIPIGAMMIINSVFVNGRSMQDAVVSMVGAVVGMIPEGFYLLLTMALTMSAARLARKKVLLHDMKSIETLARVDVLCVDKTGTITSEIMSVTDVFLPANVNATETEKESDIERTDHSFVAAETIEAAEAVDAQEKLLYRYTNTVPDTNITMVAIRQYFAEKQIGQSYGAYVGQSQGADAEKLIATEVIPFSSKLKYSEVVTADKVYRFGAPEFILSDDDLKRNKEVIEKYTGKGQRVLALVGIEPLNEKTGSKEDVSKKVNSEPLLFVSLANEIRENAPRTFSYFEEQGVKVKVISGDNPLTVSRVAMAANIEDADKYVDASTLKNEEDYLTAVKEYSVFGRVKPEQKKELICAIKKNNQKVAMTGDGVNDILAMKEADCSIAMGGGSDAARQAAQVVLLDSDFSRMTNIVSEGRCIINNLTRSGILFLYKNIFSLTVALFTIVLMIQYPMKPTQISLISMFNIGLPGFLLAMEKNKKKQEGRLLTRTLKGSIPAALLSFLSVVLLMILRENLKLTEDELGVAGTFLLSAVGFMLLWKLIHPLNKFRIGVFAVCVVGMALTVLVLWNILINAEVSGRGLLTSIIYACGSACVFGIISKLFLPSER